MKLLSLFRSEPEARPRDDDDFWYEGAADQLRGGVTPAAACTLAAVYACRMAISETLAMCPVGVIENTGPKTVRQATEHPLYSVLHDEPNSFTDSFAWWDAQVRNLIDHGNCVALIERPRTNPNATFNEAPRGLQIILPELVTAKKEDGRLKFTFTENGIRQTRDQAEIFHVSINSRDGIWGKSPFQIVGESFGLGLAVQRHALKLFENGAFFRGFVETPKKFPDDESARNFIQSIVKFMRRGNVGLLEGGNKYVPATMDNRNAQMIEGRQASVLDVCRILRVPPSFVAVTEGSKSYASVEQDAIFFVQYSLQTYATRFERAGNRQLLNRDGEKGRYFMKFNLDALLRGDLKSRTEAIVQSLRAGLRTINESRYLLDQNPIEDPMGDVPLIQMDLMPINQVGKLKETPAPPAKKASEAVVAPAPENLIGDEPAEKSLPPALPRTRFVPLFQDLMARAVRREVRALQALQQRPAFLKKAAEFYEGHEAHLREVLGPACGAFRPSYEHKLGEFLTKFKAARAEQLTESPEMDLSLLESEAPWYANKLLSLLEDKNPWNLKS